MGLVAAIGFFVLAWLLAGSLWFVYLYRREMQRMWHEPMLRRPVVIVESDDWGPAGAQDVSALESLIKMLEGQRDMQERAAVMTLGMLLSVPDREKLRVGNLDRYFRLGFDHRPFQALHATLMAGVEQGVFSLQLHGMEHYWPAALMARATGDRYVRSWLLEGREQAASQLPADLQSRWTDASSLPSVDLPEHAIKAAVEEECREFAKVFGHAAKVAVPPTFVWNDTVEQAWSEAGIEVLIASPRRNTGRGIKGELIEDDGGSISNGMTSGSGLLYMVRNCYFEPELGHQVGDKVEEILMNSRMARPSLVESHHFNYAGSNARGVENIDKLGELLQTVRMRLPNVRFLATEELAKSIAEGREEILLRKPIERVRPWLTRMRHICGLEKRAWLSGIGLVATIVWWLAGLSDAAQRTAAE